ncbi:50S ribosomal protein L11 [Candidatus Riesia pediculischaeffi]|uniref:Large ribosomal subunit protein uL11 n=2 Tax=Candidatus Riesia pediculischaeffi TaxID=428411 RepID=A0A1V0HKH7_9ENTR|nr:50S ribosomal protein L11 [Candidatus Riesia pediculischaeffi]ARC53242.1 50S ribosomal protein L11 [Candidatus Riesia pediculischaeffi]KIE64109.1 LSU ribosomal protein L11p (L12e) [Candidatus Riesia pediculischaeffi PTSU]
MSRRIQARIKLRIPAGQANPSPPVGPILGQKGINIMNFCKTFNDRTRSIEKGTIVSASIHLYSDKNFDLIIKTSPTSELLKKFSGTEIGSPKPNSEKSGKISKNQIEKIAKIKMSDMNTRNLSSIMRSIEGTARSMGIKIEK